jgi:hypothetical protein
MLKWSELERRINEETSEEDPALNSNIKGRFFARVSS